MGVIWACFQASGKPDEKRIVLIILTSYGRLNGQHNLTEELFKPSEREDVLRTVRKSLFLSTQVNSSLKVIHLIDELFNPLENNNILSYIWYL